MKCLFRSEMLIINIEMRVAEIKEKDERRTFHKREHSEGKFRREARLPQCNVAARLEPNCKTLLHRRTSLLKRIYN